MTQQVRLDRALRRLAQPGAVLAPLRDCRARGHGVFANGDRRRRPLARMSLDDVQRLESDGAIRVDDSSENFTLTPEGAARVRRQMALVEERFQEQHRLTTDTVIPDQGEGQRVRLNSAESPLLWLMRRQTGGRSFVSARELAAAERLRCDHEVSVRSPRVTMDWSGAPPLGAKRCSWSGPIAPGAAAHAARRRVQEALDVLGGDLAVVVRAVCCDERGLDAVERSLGWPRRSAKVALKLGLSRLADHYRMPKPGDGRVGVASSADR